jgi:hypothetical protein
VANHASKVSREKFIMLVTWSCEVALADELTDYLDFV